MVVAKAAGDGCFFNGSWGLRAFVESGSLGSMLVALGAIHHIDQRLLLLLLDCVIHEVDGGSGLLVGDSK